MIQSYRYGQRVGLLGLVLVIASVAPPYSKWAVADAYGGEDGLNPLMIVQDIRHLGEGTVIKSLRKDKKLWTNFVSLVSSGEQAWIDVGLLLLPHTTGAARSDLRIAFEDALIAAPVTTIRSIGPQSRILRLICGSSAHPQYDLAENSINERLSAVASVLVQENPSVTDASLRARLNRC